ncbi:dual OB domain-containing protein [Gaetbulibacter jejuensis]|uniref:Dual OB-containing domain-containing protein n=1 Tax=Gaetbulibacter jejuensis TaxID=584607 RepID=A0ABN1JS99_9FLAO
MEVLITSKTLWGKNFCIGGIEIATNRFVRLMTTIGTYQPLNAPYQIGQIWDLDYYNRPSLPPHVEDVWIYRNNGLVRNIPNLVNYIIQNCLIWNGDFNVLYGGRLSWTNGSGYLNNPNNLPNNSVGFWICNQDLHWDGSQYYIYQRPLFRTNKKIKYKGVVPPISIIPAGTIIRVSLAKWWNGQGGENRCYLQLSGWY